MFQSKTQNPKPRTAGEARPETAGEARPETTGEARPGTAAVGGRVRAGVAGVGSLGQHHARIYASLASAELVGIYETNDARAAEICAKYGCRRMATLEELGETCDAVSIVVPTDLHAAVALPLLARGCHLLIEKPICASLAEAESVLAAARASGAIVQVGHIEHFNPVMGFLEREVSAPRFITAERLAPFTPRGTEVGVVLDLMIHDIGIVLELVKSPVEKIDSVGVSVLSKTEDIANARIEFANGCVANLSTSRISLKKVREIRVFQPTGYFSFDFMNQSGHLVRKAGMLEYAAKLMSGAAKPGDLSAVPVEPVPLEKGEPLALELAHFVDSVAKAKQPKVGGVLGKTALEVAIAITEQIRGRAVLKDQGPETRDQRPLTTEH
ncbi:MAG: Gfo/Idh/MocA family oxidoreductase [Opitutaceae bacterium]|nr:Gfo/Idh/MocA family oxidoreductase [Opitutaceae bacterium]